MHSILVKDYMDFDPHAISQSTNVRDVIGNLLQQGIPGAPVIDDNEQVIGFVSEQDCIAEMLNDAFYCEEPGLVGTVMNTNVTSVSPQTSIVEIAQNMLKDQHKNYPVVDNGKLVGVISRSRILKALLENDDDCYLRH
jgi:CBS domain-containing protein